MLRLGWRTRGWLRQVVRQCGEASSGRGTTDERGRAICMLSHAAHCVAWESVDNLRESLPHAVVSMAAWTSVVAPERRPYPLWIDSCARYE